jgi:hypothetical protein
MPVGLQTMRCRANAALSPAPQKRNAGQLPVATI